MTMNKDKQFRDAYIARTQEFNTQWDASNQTQATFDTLNEQYHTNLQSDEVAIYGGDPHGHPRRPT
jgi:hypothetical protein